MDAEQRDQWRRRLERAHGSWLCPVCKVAYGSQAQFVDMAGVVELIRHRECGHVLMWRGGAVDLVAPYLAEPPLMAGLPPIAVPRLHGARPTAGRWARKYDACLECGLTDKPHASRGNCTGCDTRVRWRNRKLR